MPPDGPLKPAQSEDLRILAGIMIPARTEFDVPGADDPAIQADIVATLGRDTGLVREALDQLARLAGLALAGLDPARREAAAMALRAKGGAAVATLTRVVLQCYYRDDRVVRSLGLEPRPPHPKGHVLEDGDWSLLDPVRARAPTWRRRVAFLATRRSVSPKRAVERVVGGLSAAGGLAPGRWAP